jgi:hypothetical protein
MKTQITLRPNDPKIVPYDITCPCGRSLKGVRPTSLNITVECVECGKRHDFMKK